MSNSIVDQMNQTPLEPKKRKFGEYYLALEIKLGGKFFYMCTDVNTKVTNTKVTTQ